MKFSLDKYKYFIARREDGTPYQVVAVSTYAGKTVRGVAKCDPADNFNEEAGKKLAAARCNLKISEKRLARAAKKIHEAKQSYMNEKDWYYRMKDYYTDSEKAVKEARKELNKLEKSM